MTAILFIIILGILIFVHELGHFSAAKKSGIRVDEFAIGFPPSIYKKKVGETDYAINMIPIGGYVKIYGEDGEALESRDDKRAFFNQPKWIKALVLSAGILGNLAFAWLLLSIGFMTGLPTGKGEGDMFENRITEAKTTILNIMPESPADKAGLKINDKIVSLKSDGKIIDEISPEIISDFITQTPSNAKVTLGIERNNESLFFEVVPDEKIIPGKKAVGIAMNEIGTLKLPFYLAPIAGAKAVYNMTLGTIEGVSGLIKNALSGNGSFADVSGPVGIANMVGDAKSQGIAYLIVLVSLISINLAVINLIPIPALDGGRLLFLLIEAIIRRPIKGSISRAVNTTGFVLLLVFMAIITYHDIIKLIK